MKEGKDCPRKIKKKKRRERLTVEHREEGKLVEAAKGQPSNSVGPWERLKTSTNGLCALCSVQREPVLL
ncbi:unnamed protein product [Brassica rapa]|uniref:Uncharacterized protein n=2 Tax=Brassica TaxID=3705 RepID=A0A8D9D295_BRACM|nr:unnamed protein product [Brassica rapa]